MKTRRNKRRCEGIYRLKVAFRVGFVSFPLLLEGGSSFLRMLTCLFMVLLPNRERLRPEGKEPSVTANNAVIMCRAISPWTKLQHREP